MGIVQARREDYAAAAAAFEQVTTYAPAFAYGYYYGGQANSRIDRPDQMAINFERFLQLAPEAPEAPRVQSLLRSVRGGSAPLEHLPDREEEPTLALVFDLGERCRNVQSKKAERRVKPKPETSSDLELPKVKSSSSGNTFPASRIPRRA